MRTPQESQAFHLWAEGSRLEDEHRFDEAISFYRRAIDLGSVDALINLGNLLADVVTPRDHDGSVRLYELAVAAGDPAGAWNLGKHFENLGADRLATAWMRRAAQMGLEDAWDWLRARRE